jgi:RNA polymerase sigma-70 factor (ECF subfamily)
MPLAFSQCAQDDALLIRLRAGDEQAYAELYRRVHPRVFGFALRRLGDPTEAEDVAQDVFLQFPFDRAIRGPLQPAVLDLRHCSPHDPQPLLAPIPRDDAARRSLRKLAAPVASIEDSIDASRIWERCTRFLQRNVSATARHIFHLRYSHGRSVAAIARETGKSAGAVKVGLMRTRRILGAFALGA